MNLNKKYQKGDYRKYEIGLTESLQYVVGAKKSECSFLDEPFYSEEIWYLDRKNEAELMCDSLLNEMFRARSVNQNIRQAIIEYKRGNRIRATKMYLYEHDGMSIKEAKKGLELEVNNT